MILSCSACRYPIQIIYPHGHVGKSVACPSCHSVHILKCEESPDHSYVDAFWLEEDFLAREE
jgi:LSD1 subclass zinc finger protein